jgi:hypothetical protein
MYLDRTVDRRCALEQSTVCIERLPQFGAFLDATTRRFQAMAGLRRTTREREEPRSRTNLEDFVGGIQIYTYTQYQPTRWGGFLI